MVSGIFGGDVRQLSIKAAFPKIYELEQSYGSVIKGFVDLQRKKKSKGNGKKQGADGRMVSFRKGMSQFSEGFLNKYRDSIHLDEAVVGIDRAGEGFTVETRKIKYFADELFVCTPAFVASDLLKSLDMMVSELLAKIVYAPIAVIGLVYPKKNIKRLPVGFGYLVPSSEGKEVLGTIFSSNIFPDRTNDKYFLFQVMIGGARNPDIVQKTRKDLITIATSELKKVLNIDQDPSDEFFIIWPQAIPQYTNEYAYVKDGLLYEVQKFKNFHLVSNYLDGIGLADCLHNAHIAAEKSSL